MVMQNRIGLGGSGIEFPAGGVESQESEFAAATRELTEETGIIVDPNRLVNLGENFIICESAFTETVSWFGYKLKKAEIKSSLNSRRVHGTDDEVVKTTMKIMKSYTKLKLLVHCGLSLLKITLSVKYLNFAFSSNLI